jgi:malonate transporter MadL subunit
MAGKTLGIFLGSLAGVADIGGVAFAMLFLVLTTNSRGWERVSGDTKQGIEIASALYLPVIVAMVFQSDVYGAFASGPLALIAGLLALFTSLLLVNLISRVGGKDGSDQ